MDATKREIAVAVVGSLATAAVLSLAGVVSKSSTVEAELKNMHTDLARVDARCERIENLLMQRRK